MDNNNIFKYYNNKKNINKTIIEGVHTLYILYIIYCIV